MMKQEKIIKVFFTESDEMLYDNFINILVDNFLSEVI